MSFRAQAARCSGQASVGCRQPVAQRPARHDGLHRGGPDPVAARLPARPRRCPSNGAATLAPKSPDWCRPDDRPTRLSSICRSRRPTRHRGNRNWCRSSRPAAAPDCPIHRTGGRVAAAFQDVPDNPGGSGAHHTGLHPGCSGRNRGRPDRPPRQRPVGAHQLFQCGAASAQNQAGGSAPAGRRRRTPPASITEAKLTGPTRSSRSTAGTFRDRCNACATLIGPEKAAWKLPGA